MMKKKPYKYNSKSRLTPNSNSFPFKVNNIKNDVIQNLENTLTKFRVIEDPIPEKESLDNSFLEGRVAEKEDKKRKEKLQKIEQKREAKRLKDEVRNKKKKEKLEKRQEKEKLLQEKLKEKEEKRLLEQKEKLIEQEEKEQEKRMEEEIREEEKLVIQKEKEEKRNEKIEKKEERKKTSATNISFYRKVLFTLSSVCVVVFIFLYCSHTLFPKISNTFDSFPKRNKVDEREPSTTIDDNYLFVGGFHTNEFSFVKYGLDYHYVNVSQKRLTTKDLLNNMKSMVYDYNPSVIFLEFGISDFNDDIEVEEFLFQYKKILQEIHSNRPNAVIYVESIYPINKDMDDYDDDILDFNIKNDTIQVINNNLKDLAKKEDVQYIDLYSVLVQNDKLNPDYTEDGVHLNEDGYRKILNEINKVIG